MALTLTSVGVTHPGRVRKRNEDAFAELSEFGFYVLADGMGGHQGGDVAAQLTIETLLSYWRRHGATSMEEAEEYLHESLMVANEAVALRASQERALRGMGSTVCCLLRFCDLMIHAHVGDSRIYLCRQDNLQQLTCDHSLLAQLLASGQVGQEEAQKFLYKHVITRAIGTRKRVRADVGHLPLEEGDLYLLCSDGLTDLVSDEEILSHLMASATLEERAHRLIEAANGAGGNDNITALLVACQSI